MACIGLLSVPLFYDIKMFIRVLGPVRISLLFVLWSQFGDIHACIWIKSFIFSSCEELGNSHSNMVVFLFWQLAFKYGGVYCFGYGRTGCRPYDFFLGLYYASWVTC